jgi:hypothetical protein
MLVQELFDALGIAALTDMLVAAFHNALLCTTIFPFA